VQCNAGVGSGKYWLLLDQSHELVYGFEEVAVLPDTEEAFPLVDTKVTTHCYLKFNEYSATFQIFFSSFSLG
jgi:hypothetical protein